MPRRIGRTGFGDHLIHSLLVLIPLIAVSPVFLRDLPLLLRGILAFGETL